MQEIYVSLFMNTEYLSILNTSCSCGLSVLKQQQNKQKKQQ